MNIAEILNDDSWPIVVKTENKYNAYFAEDGKYNNYIDCECMLFPAKENRDWNKFLIISPGAEKLNVCLTL